MDRLRRDAATTQLPVIICTADKQAVDGPEAARCDGRCAMLTKPFDLDMLLTTVRAALMPRLTP